MSIVPRITLSPKQNLSVLFTNYCNKRCNGCLGRFFNRGKTRKNIRQTDIRALRHVLGPDTLVVITGGGEPTLHPLFFENFHALCRKSGSLPVPAYVTIKTNGRNFSTKSSTRAFLRKLKRAARGVDFDVTMSIDDHHSSNESHESLVEKARNLHAVAEEENIKHGYMAGVSKNDAAHFNSTEKIANLCGLPNELGKNYLGIGSSNWRTGEEFLSKNDNRLSVVIGANGEVYSSSDAFFKGKPNGSLREHSLEEILARSYPHLVVPKGMHEFASGMPAHLEIDVASLSRAVAPRKVQNETPKKGLLLRTRERVSGLFKK
jgi:organic radical activating enzyme